MTPHFTPLPTSTSIIYFRCFSVRLGQIARSVPTHSGSADLGYGAAVSTLLWDDHFRTRYSFGLKVCLESDSMLGLGSYLDSILLSPPWLPLGVSPPLGGVACRRPLSPFGPFALSPLRPVALSPCRPFALSPLVPPWLAPCSPLGFRGGRWYKLFEASE